MIDTLVQWDKEIFLFLNGLGTETWDGFWLVVTNKWGSIPFYVLLLFLSIKCLGWKRTGILLIGIALLITVTDQMANFFKYGVGRFRPCHEAHFNGIMRLVKRSCGGKYGFFSAHAASSMALASYFMVILGKRLRWLPFILLIWAIAVGYSRIYIGVHYPLDVIVGMSVGLFFGWLFARLYHITVMRMPHWVS